jgi:hypothetical protein
VTLEDRVKLQLGELLWVNLNLAQQAEDAKAAADKAQAELVDRDTVYASGEGGE